MEKQDLSKFFLIFLLIVILYASYLLLKPFLLWLMIAAVLTTIFYPWYKWFLRIFRGRKAISSFIVCVLITLIVIIPVSYFIFYAAVRAIDSFPMISGFFSQENINNFIRELSSNRLFGWVAGADFDIFKNSALSIVSNSLEWILSAARIVLSETASFVISIPIILFTMFFLFMDGRRMVEKLMHWTPLPNKYDIIIFKKFRNVSISSVLSNFITAIAQGLIGGIGFFIVGLPVFFPAIAMGFFSLLPYVGTAVIWLPAGVYLLFIGKIWQGVFLMIWGAGVIGTVDNLIRAYWIKGKAHVHPLFLIFSILGGIALFGFWGVVFGPIIISLAITILHIYEIEYEKVLEK